MRYVIIFSVILVLYLLATYIMFILVSKRFKKTSMPVIDASIEEMLKPYKDIIDKGKNWVLDKINNKETKDVYIKSKDNLALHGLLIENNKNKGLIIEMHGYRSNVMRDLYASCYNYYDMGYSLLLVDHRASGKSEGKYITFGIKESDDAISWIKYANKTYKNTPIILAGISMGASSVLMAMKDIKQDMNVKYVLVDCGYVSAYDEVLYCIKHYFHIPGKLFIDMINLWCILIGKFNLKSKNVLDCIKDKNIPLLIAHGEDDDFVPTINSKIIYEKYQGKKEILIVSYAQHGISYLLDPKRYIKCIKDFISDRSR